MASVDRKNPLRACGEALGGASRAAAGLAGGAWSTRANALTLLRLLAAPGLVVLADSYHPGWRASVDGSPAPILATNHLYRGVPVPAGRHTVRFEYRPRSVRLGAILSVVGAAGIGFLAWRARSLQEPS